MIIDKKEIAQAKKIQTRIQAIDMTIAFIINRKANLLFDFNELMKDLKNKYEIKENLSSLYIDFYTNELKIMPIKEHT
jgi:hypothetical protein